MHDPRQPDATGTPSPPPDPARLLALVRDDDLDAAIEAGLMRYAAAPGDGLDPAAQALLSQTRERLQAAWDARERYRRRNARLRARAEEKAAARSARAAPADDTPSTAPALPGAAALALARAKARAAGTGTR